MSKSLLLGANSAPSVLRGQLCPSGIGSMAATALAGCVLLGPGTPAAHAQWTVTRLNPSGSMQSWAYGASGGQQVGYAQVGGLERASLWRGSAASWVDLSAFLPSQFTFTSTATSIWTDGSLIYVAGYALNTTTSLEEAILWTRPVPAPAGAALLSLGALVAVRRRRT